MKKVVFILGTGHCGSTLLDLILSSHSDVFGLGQISELKRDYYRQGNVPFCNIHEEGDLFWTDDTKRKLLRYLRPRPKIRSLLNKIAPKAEKSIEIGLRKKVYHHLFKITSKSLLIDSSKNLKWNYFSIKGVDRLKYAESCVIYISRDGRAVVNAYRRKNYDVKIETLSRQWLEKVKAVNDFYNAYEGKKYWVKYENLATEPEITVQKICDFLGIEYEPEMLTFWVKDHYHIRGNSGTKSLISKFKYNKLITDDPHKQEYYNNHELEIKLDERWKRELSKEEIHIIESIIGETNKNIALG